jgi:pyruvate dehydrogenase E2 component (dihydrolipoamide acetyltransferase)
MIEFRLPSLGADMDEGTLLEWRVKPGDAVKRGDVIAVVDTAKAAIDVECWHDGIVHALLVPPGTKVPVGTLLAVLRAENESAEQADAALARARAAAPAPPAPPPAAPRPQVPAAPAAPAARPRASPAARRRAQELGVDLTRVAGSGADGAITILDVEAAARAAAAAVNTAARADGMRRVIAAAMARSKREIPHYYLAEDIVLARAQAWLDERNAARTIEDRLLLAPLLIKAVALALARVPELNGFWRDDRFEAADAVHVGVAISLRGGGLVAPALRDVPAKDIETLNRELLDLVARTRAGTLRSSEVAQATITVTHLGEQGVASVFGVIYPPQVALVGFGRVTTRPWIVDGEVRAVPMVTASLAADHRASDGHRGGLFLAAVRELLQRPEQLAQGAP